MSMEKWEADSGSRETDAVSIDFVTICDDRHFL